jgi:hypothetical protein
MTTQEYEQEAGCYRCPKHGRLDGPECDECDGEELPKCARCGEEIDADDQSDAQREMDCCSDDCLIDAIGDLHRAHESLKRQAADMARMLREIKAIEPDFSQYKEHGTAYAYALGTAHGKATWGLCCYRSEKEAA